MEKIQIYEEIHMHIPLTIIPKLKHLNHQFWKQIQEQTLICHISPLKVIVPNVLQIQLPKYCENNDLVIFHFWQFTMACVTNGENTRAHKLQYFPKSLRGKVVNWFAHYEITHLTKT